MLGTAVFILLKQMNEGNLWQHEISLQNLDLQKKNGRKRNACVKRRILKDKILQNIGKILEM